MKLKFIIAALLMAGGTALAGEGLKTNYYEAAINSAPDPTINYRKWTTSRDGKVILIREERDLARNGTWSQIDQIIMVDGKPAIHFLSLEGKRSVIYYPDAHVQVIHADPNGDGLLDRISLLDAKQRTVDIFQADKTGRITPVSDEELAKWQKQMEDFSEAMKDF